MLVANNTAHVEKNLRDRTHSNHIEDMEMEISLDFGLDEIKDQPSVQNMQKWISLEIWEHPTTSTVEDMEIENSRNSRDEIWDPFQPNTIGPLP